MPRRNGRHRKRHGDDRIIDADELLERSGFVMPSPKVLRLQTEQLAGEDLLARRGTQFGPFSFMLQLPGR